MHCAQVHASCKGAGYKCDKLQKQAQSRQKYALLLHAPLKLRNAITHVMLAGVSWLSAAAISSEHAASGQLPATADASSTSRAALHSGNLTWCCSSQRLKHNIRKLPTCTQTGNAPSF